MCLVVIRLSRVQDVAGEAAPAPDLVDKLLVGDFDPEAWDRMMSSAFNDDYYDVGRPPVIQ